MRVGHAWGCRAAWLLPSHVLQGTGCAERCQWPHGVLLAPQVPWLTLPLGTTAPYVHLPANAESEVLGPLVGFCVCLCKVLAPIATKKHLQHRPHSDGSWSSLLVTNPVQTSSIEVDRTDLSEQDLGKQPQPGGRAPLPTQGRHSRAPFFSPLWGDVWCTACTPQDLPILLLLRAKLHRQQRSKSHPALCKHHLQEALPSCQPHGAFSCLVLCSQPRGCKQRLAHEL